MSAEDPTDPPADLPSAPDVPRDPDDADAPSEPADPGTDLPEASASTDASEPPADTSADLPEESAETDTSEPADTSADLPEETAGTNADEPPASPSPELSEETAEPPADPPEDSPEPAATRPDPETDPDAELVDLTDIDPDDPLAAMLAELDAPRRPAPAGVQLSEELPIDPEDDLRGIEGEASLRLVSILESLLFAAARPLKVQDLRRILAETSKNQIQLALAHLIAVTRDRGIMLAQVAGGFQFRTHPDNAVWVQKMLQSKPARLSRTQIETLAIVAYRQPITRPEIDDVRGVDSGAVLKGLLERELVQIVGKKEEPGRPLLYGTTVKFLEFFNLRGLRDLPTLRDFRDLSEESKATLRTQLGATEAEALGQGVLGFPAAVAAEEGNAEMSQQPELDPTPVETSGDAPQGEPEPAPMELPGDPSPDEVGPPAPEQLPGPGPDEIRPPDPGTDSPNQPDEWQPPGPDIADVPGVDPGIGGPSEV